MRKLLYILSVLCSTYTYSIAQIEAMSLGKALSSSDLALEFGKGGTIWCEYANGSGFPYPGYINKSEYEYSGNTYYLSINTTSILNNTCRGGVISLPFSQV